MKKSANSFTTRFLIIPVILVLMSSVTITSCTKEQVADFLSELLVQAMASWDIDNEELDEIPQDLDINDETGNLPSSVDLSSKFPPTGDQGEYGTCVTWAVGYNLKTALNGIDNSKCIFAVAVTSQHHCMIGMLHSGVLVGIIIYNCIAVPAHKTISKPRSDGNGATF